MLDVALDPYSDTGHDGYVEGGEIVNDATVLLLKNTCDCENV